jgi:hypothetical protein
MKGLALLEMLGKRISDFLFVEFYLLVFILVVDYLIIQHIVVV